MQLSHSVAVLLLTPAGVPLIRDPKKPAPVYWKLPGGRSEVGETPEAAAAREIKEEIGVVLAEDDLFVVHEEDRGSHTLVIFKAELPELKGLLKTGDEREEIRVFSPKEILA